MHFTMLLLTAFVGLACGQTWNVGPCPEVSVKDPFDLTKYVGEWYEIERNPTVLHEDYAFELGLKCNRANYTAQDGYVSVVNTGVNESTGKPKRIEGQATIPDEKVPAKWKVKFPTETGFSDYWILDTDYEKYSVLYSCYRFHNIFNAQYVYILSRTPTLDESVKSNLHEMLDKYKIVTRQLHATKQDC